MMENDRRARGSANGGVTAQELQRRAVPELLPEYNRIRIEIMPGERPLSDLPRAAQEIYQSEFISIPREPTPGVKGYNGRQVGFIPYPTPTGMKPFARTEDGTLHVTLQEMPYFYARAFQKARAQGLLTAEQAEQQSPMLANVSLVRFVKEKGAIFLVGQIKGGFGEGELHAGLVAGGLDHRTLAEPDPMMAALRLESREEIDLAPQEIRRAKFDFVIHETSLGMVNFGMVQVAHSLDAIRAQYEHYTSRTLKAGSTPEVPALAYAQVHRPAGLAVVRLDELRFGLKEATCWVPRLDGSGLAEHKITDPTMRPYSEAIAALLADPDNLERLLKKA